MQKNCACDERKIFIEAAEVFDAEKMNDERDECERNCKSGQFFQLARGIYLRDGNCLFQNNLQVIQSFHQLTCFFIAQ